MRMDGIIKNPPRPTKYNFKIISEQALNMGSHFASEKK